MALTVGSHRRCSRILYFLLSMLCRARTVIRNIPLYHNTKKLSNSVCLQLHCNMSIPLNFIFRPRCCCIWCERMAKMYQKCDEIQCCCFPEIEPYFSDVRVAIILIFSLSVSLHKVLTLLFSILPYYQLDRRRFPWLL